jgi:hypothetical protein
MDGLTRIQQEILELVAVKWISGKLIAFLKHTLLILATNPFYIHVMEMTAITIVIKLVVILILTV